MSKQIFVNLPVKDLARSRAFFEALGFTFDERFCDENALGMAIDKDNGIYGMLLKEPFFKNFTTKEIADTTSTIEALLCLGLESRQAVDDFVDTALESGGRPSLDPMDEGFMYQRSFQDPDGHQWEVMWMDPAALPAEAGAGQG